LSKASQEVRTSRAKRSPPRSETSRCAPPQSFSTRVTARRSRRSINSATSLESPRFERSAHRVAMPAQRKSRDDAEGDLCVPRNHADECHARPGEEHPERHQRRHRAPVGEDSEDRLHRGRTDGRRQHQRAGHGHGESPLGDQERQQRRQDSQVQVREQVTGGQDPDRPPICALAQRLRGPTHAPRMWSARTSRITCCAFAASMAVVSR
jgi:hypothetical protein